jgi:hypothetical protein
MPPAPHGKEWHRVVDTNLPPPHDFTPVGQRQQYLLPGIHAYCCKQCLMPVPFSSFTTCGPSFFG